MAPDRRSDLDYTLFITHKDDIKSTLNAHLIKYPEMEQVIELDDTLSILTDLWAIVKSELRYDIINVNDKQFNLRKKYNKSKLYDDIGMIYTDKF